MYQRVDGVPSGFLKSSGTLGRMRLLTCTRGFMGFSGFLKSSGTLVGIRPWVYQRVYGVLWIFEVLWYTWENEALGYIRGFIGFSRFLKTSGTL